MKDFISRYFPQITVFAVAVYALLWYLIYWYTDDLILASAITAVLVLLDIAVLAWLYQDEIRSRLGGKG